VLLGEAGGEKPLPEAAGEAGKKWSLVLQQLLVYSLLFFVSEVCIYYLVQ
jgi:hypothetical protein